MIKFVIERGAKRIELPVSADEMALRDMFDEAFTARPIANRILRQDITTNPMTGLQTSIISLGTQRMAPSEASQLKEDVDLFAKSFGWEVVYSSIVNNALSNMNTVKTTEDVAELRGILHAMKLMHDMFGTIRGFQTAQPSVPKRKK